MGATTIVRPSTHPDHRSPGAIRHECEPPSPAKSAGLALRVCSQRRAAPNPSEVSSPKPVPSDAIHSVVLSRHACGPRAQLRLQDGQILDVHRFAPVGKGNTVALSGTKTWIDLGDKGSVPLTPGWCWRASLDIGESLNIEVKEIESADDLEGYRRLTRLHYRGGGVAGRTAPLIAVTDHWEVPRVIGFVEIASTFIVNAARAQLLNGHFVDHERSLAWPKWNAEVARRCSSAIARISRCVVYPELRGLGLATLLVTAAKDFASNRWHLGGMRPSFLEITAEMLRYWPFVRGCGFHYAGETQGNKHRAARDMKYLVSRRLGAKKLPEGGGGIMWAQRSYAETIVRTIKDQNSSIDEIVQLLQVAPEKLTDEQWLRLHSVYRRPKPTYIAGLTEAATKYLEVQARHRKALTRASETLQASTRSKRSTPIRLVGLAITATASPLRSAQARRVQEAFGIVAKEFFQTVVDDLDIPVNPGEVTLIGGPSGSGKSLLVRSICQLAGVDRRKGKLPAGVSLKGVLEGRRIGVALPKPPDPRKAPIELVRGDNLDRSLRVLARAGLAEAQLFVRPSRTLSLGQRYRLSIALALAERPQLLLIDEFCEPLDRLTASAVCRRLRAWSKSESRSLIVATADPGRVLHLLRPDRVLLLSSDGSASWHREV